MGRYQKYNLNTLSETLGPGRQTEEKRKSERKLFDAHQKHTVPEEKRKRNGRESGSSKRSKQSQREACTVYPSSMMAPKKFSIGPAGVNGRKTEAPRKVKSSGGPVAQISLPRSLSHTTASPSCFFVAFLVPPQTSSGECS